MLFLFFVKFLLKILASASSFTYYRCFPLIHRVHSKLRYVSFHFIRNSRFLKMVAIILVDRVRSPSVCYLLFCCDLLLPIIAQLVRASKAAHLNPQKAGCHHLLLHSRLSWLDCRTGIARSQVQTPLKP